MTDRKENDMPSYAIEKFVDEGSRSRFYSLSGRRRGFKTFINKSDAEYAYEVQVTLSKYDLAPRVHSEVGRVRMSNGELSRWGYVTERAKLITPRGHEGGCHCGRCEDMDEYYSEEIFALKMELEDLGFYFGDCHIGNVGHIRRNGQDVLVCIDTGRESIESEFTDDEDMEDCNCTVCRVIRRKGQYA
jgi:hypothetical protein